MKGNQGRLPGAYRKGIPGNPHRRYGAFVGLVSVQMSLVAAISLVSMALPEMQRDFAIGPSDLAWVVASYGLAFSGLLVVGGRTADAVGPKRALAAGTAVFGAAAAAGVLAPSFGALVAARMVQGAAAAFTAPAALVLAESLFPDGEGRARMLAVWGGASGAGAVVGMLLSGVIVASLPWRWVSAPPALVAGLVLPFVLKGTPSVPPVPGAQPDYRSSALLTAGLSATTYGLLTVANGAGAARGIAFAAAGLLALLAFAAVDARAPWPLIPRNFFASATRRLGVLAILAASGASASASFFLTLYFRQVRGLPPLEASLYFVPFLLLIAMGAVAGRFLQRYGPFHTGMVGSGCAALALVLFAQLVGQAAPEGPLPLSGLAGFALFPTGLGLVFAAATVSAMAGVPAGQRGLGGGVVNTAMEVGPTLGLALLVTLAQWRTEALVGGGLAWTGAVTGGYAVAFFAAAAVLAVLGAAFAAAARARPLAAPNPNPMGEGG